MKTYSYKNKLYCEKNLSRQIENYGGNLFNLYIKFKEDEDNDITPSCVFTSEGELYEDAEEFFEAEFKDYFCIIH